MAIELNPKVPAYYGNRSFCYIKTEYYGYALEDANKAIELDKKYIKVRLYLQYLVNNHGIQSEEQVRLLIAKSCLQEVTWRILIALWYRDTFGVLASACASSFFSFFFNNISSQHLLQEQMLI